MPEMMPENEAYEMANIKRVRWIDAIFRSKILFTVGGAVILRSRSGVRSVASTISSERPVVTPAV